MTATRPFHNLYTHHFARVAVGVPQCRVADPIYNAAATIRLAQEAAAEGAILVAFPELGLSAYTCDDLFHQQALLEACHQGLQNIVHASEKFSCAIVIGMPLMVDHLLFNCAVVVCGGKIHGIVPKSFLPNYGEFYEARQFSPADCAQRNRVSLFNAQIPFGTDLLFDIEQLDRFRFHIELCEDVWVPIPPSSFAALAGATVLVNLSASNALVGKAAYRHQLVAQQSARCLAAYLYTSAGMGESTTDMAWDGHALIYENGECLAQSERFLEQSQLIYADVDLERLSHERMRQTSFGQSVRTHGDAIQKFKTIFIDPAVPNLARLDLRRTIERFPYVPSDPARRDERCTEVYHIQVQALMQRLSVTGISKVVIGVSGGLDSTHALLVCAKVMDGLQLPRSNILGVTMPGFATSTRTLAQARALMTHVGCTASEIDIRPSCMQMLRDIDHPYADGSEVFDITFENVQAGERTSHLFRIANLHQAIVIGTGDLSELALGWSTYGVGDHMSHYNVNASVPKTLIAYLVRWVAESHQIAAEGSEVLLRILETEISPELVPVKRDAGSGSASQSVSNSVSNSASNRASNRASKKLSTASSSPSDDGPTQKTQERIGPYELHDFSLYYILRFGFKPSKVAFLACHAWGDVAAGTWPQGPLAHRNHYDLAAIKRNLSIFVDRFFRTSQFKRSCVPNAPKVGSGGSLSPRGDWRAPSDAQATAWLSDLDNIPEL